MGARGAVQWQKDNCRRGQAAPPYAVAIMPGQTIWKPGVFVEGELYRRILSGDFDGELTQWLRVSYGTSKEGPTDYFTYQEIAFDISDMPSDLKDTPHPGIWNVVDMDFK